MKMKKRIGYVYKITSPKGKIYIGSTVQKIENRWNFYKNLNCRNQIKLYNSFIKYGVNTHTFEVLWQGDSLDMLKYECILGTWFEVLDKNKGLNLKLPKYTDNYQSMSNETRNKISKSNLGKKMSATAKENMSKKILTDAHKDKLRNARLGKTQSKETKDKIRNSMLKRKITPKF